MKELVRHLESLLLNHDCVAVPQIGGFVTSNQPARYVEEESLYLPPFRTVGFNDRLKTDDRLLVQSYVEVYKCTEAEAKKMIGEEIRNLQKELWDTGSYDLGSIGVLSLDDTGNIQFSPCLAGTVCPMFYGLDALWMQSLKNETESDFGTNTPAVPAAKSVKTTNNNQDKDEIVIRLKKSWLYNAAAVAAIILIFFFVSPETKNAESNNNAHTQFSQLFRLPESQQTTTEQKQLAEQQPVKTEKKEQPKSEPTKEEKEPEKIDEKKESAKAQSYGEVKKGYCVVVASALSEKNAQKYVERLHKEGFEDAQIYKKGDMIRVVFAGYRTEDEARAKKRELNKKSNEFSSAWIYEIK